MVGVYTNRSRKISETQSGVKNRAKRGSFCGSSILQGGSKTHVVFMELYCRINGLLMNGFTLGLYI